MKPALMFVLLLAIAGCSHFQRGLMAAKGNLFPELAEDLSQGEQVFSLHCVRCHGRTGAGNGPDSNVLEAAPPDFTDGSYRKSLGLTAATVMYGKGAEMPAFERRLTEREIWSVARFVRSLD